ncbi:MAG: hypothetical protein ACI9KN_001239 [Gammaproteobacteria bacterium]|jgi:hypothetical protein
MVKMIVSVVPGGVGARKFEYAAADVQWLSLARIVVVSIVLLSPLYIGG